MSNPAKKAAHRFVAEIQEVELTLRIAEAACDFKRPAGRSADLCLAQLEASDPETIASFRRIAQRVVDYFGECVRNGSTPS